MEFALPGFVGTIVKDDKLMWASLLWMAIVTVEVAPEGATPTADEDRPRKAPGL